MEAIQRYQTVEQDSRKKHKQRMERQYKIVKPDATQEEVSNAIDDNMGSGGNRIFEQAVSVHALYLGISLTFGNSC